MIYPGQCFMCCAFNKNTYYAILYSPSPLVSYEPVFMLYQLLKVGYGSCYVMNTCAQHSNQSTLVKTEVRLYYFFAQNPSLRVKSQVLKCPARPFMLYKPHQVYASELISIMYPLHSMPHPLTCPFSS